MNCILDEAYRNIYFIIYMSMEFEIEATSIKLYNACIGPNLGFACNIRSPQTQEHTTKIEILQKKFIKI